MAFKLNNIFLEDTANGKSVQRESIIKASNLMVIPKPRSDGDTTLALDYLGVTTRISVDGTVVSSAKITQFLTDFLGGVTLTGGVIDGSQPTVPYLGSNGITIDVKCLNIKTSVTATETDQILTYTFDLIQGT